MKHFATLLDSGKTVFRYQDIRILLGIDNGDTLKSFVSRACKQWVLQRISSGVFAFMKYDTLELASILRKKSYISLETVLAHKGVIFQNYSNTITLISDDTLIKKVAEISIEYFAIKDSILLNPLGLENTWKYLIASPERAFCDRVYLSGDVYFDNIESLDLQKLATIATIYNQTTVKRINQLISHVKNR